MSASLAASSPSPQPALRLLPADPADDANDARVAALLDRLAPDLAADAARNDADGRFPHENFARLHRAG
ncbi:acyl-CoA dehydrogenase, partial [Burkholderia sp. Tr-20355]|nr:acyl-CoA dehydrogenase [Burkholderia sp. Tr-20355]